MTKNDNLLISWPLYVTAAFVIICSSFAMLHEGGMFSISEEQKILKIKQCTADNFGLNIEYLLFSGKVHNVKCCTKYEAYCDLRNLGETNEK